MALSVRQLQRDQLSVHDDLRQARLRLATYETQGEDALAQHLRRVIAGLEDLWDTLTTRLDSITTDAATP